MKLRKTAAVAVAVLALTATACGGKEGSAGDKPATKPGDASAPKLPTYTVASGVSLDSPTFKKAKERGTPIRIGVNYGSVAPMTREFVDEMAEQHATQIELRAEWMVRSALGHIKILEDLDFGDIKVSLKAFEVPVMIEAYRRFAALPGDYPLHLGVTEAGTPRAGSIRSAVGIGTLLALGIGDTIRVSLTTDPVEEVFVGFEILKTLGLRQHGATLVACPTCGRVEVDLFKLANEVDDYLKTIKEPIKVEAGEFECTVSELRGAGARKSWFSRKHPGLCVKTTYKDDLVETTTELIEFNE